MKINLKSKKEKKPGIQRRITAAYARYTGTLPPALGSNQDALTAKVVVEGSLEVGWQLLREAREDGNFELERALRDSFAAARQRLDEMAGLWPL